MTTALLLYTDGEIREIDLDPTRGDVILALLDTTTADEIEIDDEPDRVVFMFDRYSTRDVAPLNVYATLYVFASRREPFHGVHGDVLLLGRTVDGAWTDAPEPLVEIFHTLSQIPTT